MEEKILKTLGYDVDSSKIENLKKGVDITGEYEDSELEHILNSSDIIFSDVPSEIRNADFIHICVPTLLKNKSEPDMRHIENASRERLIDLLLNISSMES